MIQEILLKKFESLSNQEKKEVLDFIDFLKNKKSRFKRILKKSVKAIENEEFIGMWKERPEMEDSTAWVRNLRKNDWVG